MAAICHFHTGCSLETVKNYLFIARARTQKKNPNKICWAHLIEKHLHNQIQIRKFDNIYPKNLFDKQFDATKFQSVLSLAQLRPSLVWFTDK